LILAASSGAYAYLTGPLLQVVLTGGEQGVGYLLLPGLEPGWVTTISGALLLVAVLLVALGLRTGFLVATLIPMAMLMTFIFMSVNPFQIREYFPQRCFKLKVTR